MATEPDLDGEQRNLIFFLSRKPQCENCEACEACLDAACAYAGHRRTSLATGRKLRSLSIMFLAIPVRPCPNWDPAQFGGLLPQLIPMR